MAKENNYLKCFGIFSLIVLVSINLVFAGTLSLSLGSYDSEIYTQETLSVPVIVTASNITGNADITLAPKTGLSCSTCTVTASFSGATNEQETVTFTLTGTQTGNYNPPFISISGSSGSTSATPLSSGSQVAVVERPTWVTSLTTSDSSPNANDEITLTLSITPTGTFEGVSADLLLSSGLTRVSGPDPRTIGTISGSSTYQWVVRAVSSGTATVAISATSPYESSSNNQESVTITIAGSENNDGSGGSGGSAGGAAGGALTYSNYIVNDTVLKTGYTKEVTKSSRFRFNIGQELHFVTIDSINANSATITVNSTPQTATLNVGDEKKFELNGDDLYDLSVKLNKINATSSKGEFTIKSISEQIPKQAVVQSNTTSTQTAIGSQTNNNIPTDDNNKTTNTSMWGYIIGIIVGIMIIVVIILVVIFIKKRK